MRGFVHSARWEGRVSIFHCQEITRGRKFSRRKLLRSSEKRKEKALKVRLFWSNLRGMKKTIIISSSFPCRPFNKCIKFPNKWWLPLHYLVTANQHETFFWSTMSFLTPDTVDALFEKHGLILRGKWWICHRSILWLKKKNIYSK